MPDRLHTFLLFFIPVFFNKDCDVKFRHIGKRHTAADQKDPFRHLQKTGKRGRMSDSFYNTLMQQCFADITVKKRNTGNAMRSRQKTDMQQRLLFSESSDFIQI